MSRILISGRPQPVIPERNKSYQVTVNKVKKKRSPTKDNKLSVYAFHSKWKHFRQGRQGVFNNGWVSKVQSQIAIYHHKYKSQVGCYDTQRNTLEAYVNIGQWALGISHCISRFERRAGWPIFIPSRIIRVLRRIISITSSLIHVIGMLTFLQALHKKTT